MADGFNFDNFSKQLEEQRVKTEQRQAVAVETQDRQAGIRQQSTNLAGQYAKDVGFLKTAVETSQQKATHARELADSQNPLDTLRLMGLQMMDPGGYTRQTRSARLAEDMGRASALGQYYGIQQQALESQLMSSTSELDRAKLAEEIGMEKLTLLTDQAAMAERNLAASNTMQKMAITQLDATSIDAAIQQAKVNPQRQTNIGGIDIGLTALEDRKFQLTERDFLMRSQASNAGAREQELRDNELKPALMEYDRNTNLDKLANEDSDRRSARIQRQLAQQDLFHQTQEKILSTMNTEEHLFIRNNGYRDKDGTSYNPAAVDQAYSRAVAAESDNLNRQIAAASVGSFDTEMLSQQKQRIDTIAPRLPANSPAAKAAREFKTAVGLTGNFIGPDADVSQKILAISTFQRAEQKFEEAISTQAKFESKGDKNVEEMLLEYYRGNEVPISSLFDSIKSRFEKGRTAADILPPQVAARVQAEYSKVRGEKLQAAGGFGASVSAEDRKIIEADSVREAVESISRQQVQRQADGIIRSQVTHPQHPLFGKISEEKMSSEIATADMMARRDVQSQFGLTEEQMGMILAGAVPEGVEESKIGSILQSLSVAENTGFLLRMEALQPGNGRKVVDWWQEHGASYVDGMNQTLNKPNTFGEAILSSLSKDRIGTDMAAYSAGLFMSEDTIRSEQAKRFGEMITFGSDPQQAQAVILDGIKEFESPEKRQLWLEVFMPLLADASQRGLDFEKTNIFIENAIASDELKVSPSTKSLLKTLRRTRPGVVSGITNMQNWGESLWGMNPRDIRGNKFGDWYPGHAGQEIGRGGR